MTDKKTTSLLRESRKIKSQLSEQGFDFFLDHMGDAIYVLEKNSARILYCNKTAEQMLGYSRDELLNLHASEIEVSLDITAINNVHNSVRLGGMETVEGTHLRKDGSSLPVEVKITSLAPMHPDRVLSIVRDITDRKQAEALLLESDRRKDLFIATLAHELRNPLAPIRSGLDVLRSIGERQEAEEYLLTAMDRQVNHLVRLVDDLMEISRIHQGKIELRKERMDVAIAIHDAVDMNRELIEEAGMKLSVDIPDEPLSLEGDPIRLTQVFANLLTNAVKFTNPNGRIDIMARRIADEAVVSVVDTGMGIAKEMLPHIFDMFTQSEAARNRPGAGLGIGLSLVRGITELHGGVVEACSKGDGLGSEFVVRLPLLANDKPGIFTSTQVAADPPMLRRVLIIDDVPDVADTLAMLLEKMGADVRVAYSGAAGLALCAEFSPDLIFVDIGMPVMDGLETARRIRELPAGKRAMLIAQTGWGDDETRTRVGEAGFDRHLTKPAGVRDYEALLDCAPRHPGPSNAVKT